MSERLESIPAPDLPPELEGAYSTWMSPKGGKSNHHTYLIDENGKKRNISRASYIEQFESEDTSGDTDHPVDASPEPTLSPSIRHLEENTVKEEDSLSSPEATTPNKDNTPESSATAVPQELQDALKLAKQRFVKVKTDVESRMIKKFFGGKERQAELAAAREAYISAQTKVDTFLLQDKISEVHERERTSGKGVVEIENLIAREVAKHTLDSVNAVEGLIETRRGEKVNLSRGDSALNESALASKQYGRSDYKWGQSSWIEPSLLAERMVEASLQNYAELNQNNGHNRQNKVKKTIGRTAMKVALGVGIGVIAAGGVREVLAPGPSDVSQPEESVPASPDEEDGSDKYTISEPSPSVESTDEAIPSVESTESESNASEDEATEPTDGILEPSGNTEQGPDSGDIAGEAERERDDTEFAPNTVESLMVSVPVESGDGVTQVLAKVLAQAGYTNVLPEQLFEIYEELVTDPEIGPGGIFGGITLEYNQASDEYWIQGSGGVDAHLTLAAAKWIQDTVLGQK